MPDAINNEGLQLKTLTEIREELVAALKDIYGADINVDQNSPDGQMITIFAQAAVDTRELLQTIHNNFDPDQAQGVVLDQRVGINGIVRKEATFTSLAVTISVDKPVDLIGLDNQSSDIAPDVANLFTVKDGDGNEFYLLKSVTIEEPGAEALFRAKEIGKVEISVGQITSAVTVIGGVTGVENHGGVAIQGQDEETDAQLKLRRSRSVSISAIGYLESIYSNIANLDNVSAVRVYENDTGERRDTIPAHSIWVIVDGGDDDEIADVLYRSKTAGTGMKGDVTVSVDRPNGLEFEARFDRPENVNLYIRLNAYEKNTEGRRGSGTEGTVITETEATRLKTLIAENLVWEIGQNAGADDIIDFVKDRHPQFRIKNVELASSSSDSDVPGTYEEVALTERVNSLFINSVDRISINPDPGDADE